MAIDLTELNTQIASIDAQIRRGQADDARKSVLGLVRGLTHRQAHLKASVRPALAELARLSRRLGLAAHALRILHPMVRPSGRRPATASDAEKAEYAIALLRMGGVVEARDLLRTVSINSYPAAGLYQVFCDFALWDYFAGDEKLRGLCELAEPGSYDHAVAGINRLSALSYIGRWDEAQALADDLRPRLEALEARRLLANLHEIEAQISLFQRDFPRAKLCMDRADELLSPARGADRLYLRRWQVLWPLLQLKHPRPERERPFTELVRDAYAEGDMETARVLQFHLAVAFPSEKSIASLYAGSPSPGFHKVLDVHFGKRPRQGRAAFSHAVSRLEDMDPDGSSVAIAVGSGGLEIGRGSKRFQISLTPAELRLFRVLLEDSCRLQAPASLHFSLTGGYPISSPNRVDQLLFRLRRKLESLQSWVAVRHHRSFGYYLHSRGPILAPESWSSAAMNGIPLRLQNLLKVIEDRHGTEAFSLRELPKIYPERTLKRDLATACTKGLISKTGHTRSARYRLRHEVPANRGSQD